MVQSSLCSDVLMHTCILVIADELLDRPMANLKRCRYAKVTQLNEVVIYQLLSYSKFQLIPLSSGLPP